MLQLDISKLKIIVKVDGDFIPVANFKYKIKTNDVNVCFACSFIDPSTFRKSKGWFDIEKDDSTYKRRLRKKNWIDKLSFRKYEESWCSDLWNYRIKTEWNYIENKSDLFNNRRRQII